MGAQQREVGPTPPGSEQPKNQCEADETTCAVGRTDGELAVDADHEGDDGKDAQQHEEGGRSDHPARVGQER